MLNENPHGLSFGAIGNSHYNYTVLILTRGVRRGNGDGEREAGGGLEKDKENGMKKRQRLREKDNTLCISLWKRFSEAVKIKKKHKTNE